MLRVLKSWHPRITFLDEQSGEKEEWFYEDGLKDYILSATQGWPVLPELPFMGSFSGETEAVDWAVQWLPEGGDIVAESYVDLILVLQF